MVGTIIGIPTALIKTGKVVAEDKTTITLISRLGWFKTKILVAMELQQAVGREE
jgi:hypothetical protein